jgi:hypothetical protein
MTLWTEELRGRVIFVSHEWLGLDHPDPHGEQFAALQHMLKRLMAGDIKQVERCWQEQIAFKSKEMLGSEAWMDALPDMYIWLDYMSVPQPRATETIKGETRLRSTSDHRLAVVDGDTTADLVKDLQLAVASIPAYIERSDLILVLAPGCMHVDRRELCNFGTWQSRGWCRLELQAAYLNPADIPVMVCADSEAEPYFKCKWEAMSMPVGEGQFTCCRLGHKSGGQSIPCDRYQVRLVLEEMIDAKAQYLEETGQMGRYRWLQSLRCNALQGLPAVEKVHLDAESSSAPPQSPLQQLKKDLRWTPHDDDEGRRDGRSLLLYACMSGNVDAVRSIVEEDCSVELGMELRDPMLELGEYPTTPLMASMVFSSFEAVEILLSAKADPEQRIAHSAAAGGADALLLAALHGSANVMHWLKRFPEWDLERRDELGLTALQMAIIRGADACKTLAVVKALLAAGANPMTCANSGNNILTAACFADRSYPEVLQTLLKTPVDVNKQQVPSKGAWRAKLRCARAVARLNSKSLLLQEISHWEGRTPLMAAARQGHLTAVEMLLHARADPRLRNRRGETALDLATRCCLPPLQAALGIGS